MLGPFLFWCICAIGVASAQAADDQQDRFVTGGPLAGVELPLFPTQHGEPPGHPGCLPGKFDADGQAPELALYPGSVEHYRTYYDKYLPVRSMFDRQTLVRNWVAPDIPGVQPKHVEEYAEPLYYVARHGGKGTRHTGLFNQPVKVVRCTVDDPVMRFDFGELDVGLYVVRVVGAVETKQIRPFRRPLVVAMRVNDGLDGGTSSYRIRCGYVDEFYSVAELYFHTVEKRRYRAELFLDEGSQVDLLVRNVTLDDVLAPMIRRAIKSRMTLHEPGKGADWAKQGRSPARPLSREARWARDRAIWRAFPPINAQGNRQPGMAFGRGHGVTFGTDKLAARQIREQYGEWEPVHRGFIGPVSGCRFDTPEEQWDSLLVNRKLRLTYTIDDLHAGRSLPDPYPLKDNGTGLYFPNPDDPSSGRWWTPIADEVGRLQSRYHYLAGKGGDIWQATRDEHWARDGAVALIRYAYQFPALDNANQLPWVVHEQGPAYAADPRCRKRTTRTHWHGYAEFLNTIYWYDLLFDYIQGNGDLAQSLCRFVPWIRNTDDLIKLLDVYLVQHQARRVLRYHDLGNASSIAIVAAALGDRTIGDQWMEMALTRVHEYPNRPAGIQDLLISNTDRNGCLTIGATSYAFQGAIPMSKEMLAYVRAVGGSERFDLRRLSSKPLLHFDWFLNTTVGGFDFARIGDVAGPDKPPDHMLRKFLGHAGQAWQWSGDPRYAWVLAHVRGRRDESDEQWDEIRQAAAGMARAPWLDLPSRVVPNWFAVLEAGRHHDDYRLRRAAYVRSGVGVGHEHFDTFDLQLVAHGLPMTIDGGQRSGYSKPNDRFTCIHNLVEVSDRTRSGYGHPALYSWTDALCDTDGAQYMRLTATPPPHTDLYQRQIALVDVDEGVGSANLSFEQQVPGEKLPEVAATAHSYVVDVFRVAGGPIHTYCFHGPLNDTFEWNVNERQVEHVKSGNGLSTEADYLSVFEFSPDSKFAGNAPETLVATWRYRRQPLPNGKIVGSEQQMLGINFDKDSPRKYTRLHLLGADGLRALRANVVCHQWGYHFTQLLAQKRGQNVQSAFAAVLEPYAGEPFVESAKLLPTGGSTDDAQRPVAVEVLTTNGHRDVMVFGRDGGESLRVGELEVEGQFVAYSTDEKGLLMASLVGGTRLTSPHVCLAPEKAKYVGNVTEVDYDGRTLWIDAPWPTERRDTPFVIGTPQKWATYTSVSVEPNGNGSKLTLRRGADYYRSRITRVVPANGRVDCVLNLPVAIHRRPVSVTTGRPEPGAWVASNEQRTKFWRARHLGGNDFQLTGGPVSSDDFEPAGVLRLWEYGVGDQAKLATHASVRRVAEDTYRVQTNVAKRIQLRGRTASSKTGDGRWSAPQPAHDGWVLLSAPADACIDVQVHK